jgi:hypothetical protein
LPVILEIVSRFAETTFDVKPVEMFAADPEGLIVLVAEPCSVPLPTQRVALLLLGVPTPPTSWTEDWPVTSVGTTPFDGSLSFASSAIAVPLGSRNRVVDKTARANFKYLHLI